MTEMTEAILKFLFGRLRNWPMKNKKKETANAKNSDFETERKTAFQFKVEQTKITKGG